MVSASFILLSGFETDFVQIASIGAVGSFSIVRGLTCCALHNRFVVVTGDARRGAAVAERKCR
jgi:hypothetical protein